jgi:GTPase involved in cell partitioning and DNA repair
MHKTSPLTPGDPADGADGADVMLICDPSVDTLLHLHKRKTYTAPRGANGNPAAGSAGPKRNEMTRKALTPPMLIPVPPGTVVKKKGSGAVRRRRTAGWRRRAGGGGRAAAGGRRRAGDGGRPATAAPAGARGAMGRNGSKLA